jgi:hypothetical protein
MFSTHRGYEHRTKLWYYYSCEKVIEHHVFVCRISNWSAVVRVGSTRRWLRWPRRVHSILLRGFPDEKTWRTEKCANLIYIQIWWCSEDSRPPFFTFDLGPGLNWSLCLIDLDCYFSFGLFFVHQVSPGCSIMSHREERTCTVLVAAELTIWENYPIFHQPGLTHPVVTWLIVICRSQKTKASSSDSNTGWMFEKSSCQLLSPWKNREILWDTAYVYSIYIHLVPLLKIFTGFVEKKTGPTFRSPTARPSSWGFTTSPMQPGIPCGAWRKTALYQWVSV